MLPGIWFHQHAQKLARILPFCLPQLAKQAEVAAVKAAKRFETFHARKLNGSFQEYECVLVMDTSTSGTSLGLAIAAELDRRKTIAWQVREMKRPQQSQVLLLLLLQVFEL